MNPSTETQGASSSPQPATPVMVPSPAEHNPFGAPPKDLPSVEPAPPSRRTDFGDVRVQTVDLNDPGDRKRFLAMVEPIYRGDPNFIMPLWFERMKFLNPAKNRALRDIEMNAMVAVRGGRIVGRITAHVDHAYNRYHDTPHAGWFGFFECIDDATVAHALLTEACAWLKARGIREVIGPMNFSTNHQCGLLVENFTRPAVVEMTYNPPYYEALLTSFGFAKAKDLYAWLIDVRQGTDNPKVGRIARIADQVQRRAGVTLRHADMKRFDQEVATLFTIYNEAWQKNWGFVPVGEEEFRAIAADLKAIVREELVLFVELDGKPVAFSVTLPDVNEVMPRDGRLFPFGWWKLATGIKKIPRARLVALGVAPAYRKRGLETLLFVETVRASRRLGIEGGEIGWTLEDNDLINRAIESMDGKLDRRYRLLGLRLD